MSVHSHAHGRDAKRTPPAKTQTNAFDVLLLARLMGSISKMANQMFEVSTQLRVSWHVFQFGHFGSLHFQTGAAKNKILTFRTAGGEGGEGGGIRSLGRSARPPRLWRRKRTTWLRLRSAAFWTGAPDFFGRVSASQNMEAIPVAPLLG